MGTAVTASLAGNTHLGLLAVFILSLKKKEEQQGEQEEEQKEEEKQVADAQEEE